MNNFLNNKIISNKNMSKYINVLLIDEAKDFHEMEFIIAELLYNNEDSSFRNLIELLAREKVKKEGWLDCPYSIPNVNGLNRPLTRYEIEEIMLEDKRDEVKRRRHY
jgi:hypothetical protein